MNPTKQRQSYIDQTDEMIAEQNNPDTISQRLLIEILYWLMVVVEKLDDTDDDIRDQPPEI